jgi:hypothetical protein
MNARTFPLLLLLGSLAPGLTSCASAGPGSGGYDSYSISSEELAGVDAGNVYDAIQRLRPRWLTVGSTRSLGMDTIIGVFQGQSYLGEPDVLRQYPLTAVARLRYVDSATATATLPRVAGKHFDGAILLETR